MLIILLHVYISTAKIYAILESYIIYYAENRKVGKPNYMSAYCKGDIASKWVTF